MAAHGNYYLTAVVPIDYVRGGPQGKLRELEDVLSNMLTSQPFEGPDQRREVPFAVMPMVHMVRFLIMDELPVQMGNEKSGSLSSKYLVFIAELDGDRDTFLKAFYRGRHDVVRDIFKNCVGFPEDCLEHQFVRYIKRYEIPSTLAFSAYPDLAQPQIRNMLDVQRNLTKFIAANQTRSPQDLFNAWQEFIDDLDSLDLTPREARRVRKTS
jgi:hypothetical protein